MCVVSDGEIGDRFASMARRVRVEFRIVGLVTSRQYRYCIRLQVTIRQARHTINVNGRESRVDDPLERSSCILPAAN